MDIHKVLTTPPPVLDQVLPGLLAGTFGVCAAAGGSGKTTLLLQMCFALATGTPLCDGLFEDIDAVRRAPAKVVMVCAEESASIIWHRLHAIAAHLLKDDPSMTVDDRAEFLRHLQANLVVFPLQGVSNLALLDEDFAPTDSFSDLADVCKSARLVVLDPLRQFHRGDENKSDAMNAVAQLLQQLATRSGAAVIAAHHTNRASTNEGNADQAGAARGSTALSDAARWQANLWRPTPAILKQYDIAADDVSRYVCLNIAKANYMAPRPLSLLQRVEGGVLAVVPPRLKKGVPTRRRGAPQRGAANASMFADNAAVGGKR
ncbi:helicase RepA family protein [Variovorax sp. J22R24]|uniref:helicase RepA family protein n=1 Tax=Variovorax gracilis TaxID=3053502 RepID=UPI002575D81F|nr:helicase RepA family protein [Variovorax sp. J22R24]MDM0108680.1 helicase RepA family protein [Variovorax sp. J22R24]